MMKNKYLAHKETIHNFIWRLLQVFGKQGITILIFILCAKLLAPYDFGIYNYVLAIIFFLIMFGDFGISTATSKYVAEYNTTNKEKLKAVLFNSGIIILGITILITVLTLIIGPLYLKDKYIYVFYLLPLVFLAPMTSLYDGIYRGLKKFKQLAIISTIIGFISIFFVYFLIKEYGLIGALVSQNLFYLILLIGLGLGYRDFNFKLNKQVIKEIGSYSFVYGLATLGYFLFSRVDILILGHYNYIDEIAVYELLNKIFLVLLMPFTILGQIMAPNYSERSAKKEYSLIKWRYKTIVKKSILISLISLIILAFIVPTTIRFWFSEYYSETFILIFYPTLIIYSISFFNAPINAGIIVSTGYAKLMSAMNIYLGVFNAILSIVLLKIVGFIGVIYATVISLIIGTSILQIRFYKILKDEAKKQS